ncbi:MAG: chemotaxis protein CheW [Pseudomonadota bacterium]|nr:chemotaxis protein CheW [Pseudomonadota bacterium]MDP1903685.1 chemotaxis protein CheW [Pseudomonadota bacterium]MDP2354384.1 chemotaxis protein CheW [Pseudomonadota bacterium]
MSIDMSQFYQVFFDETSEHLASMETLLLNLDVDNPSLEELNAIFRAAHSIKGGSGTFGFTDMTSVTHVLESLLDRLRKEELRVRPDMVDAFLAAGDILRAQLEHHQGGPEADAGEVEAVCARLNQLAAGEEAVATAVADEAAVTAVAPVAAPEARRVLLECDLPANVVNDAGMLANLLEGLAEIAALDIRRRPDAASPRFSAVLTTQKRDAELKEALAFHLSPDEITLADPEQPGAEVSVAAAADDSFGFFDDAPGTPAAEAAADDGFGFFDDAPGLPDTTLDALLAAPQAIPDEDKSGAYGLFEDAAGKLENLPNRDIKPSDSPAAIEGQGYGIFVDAPSGVGLFDGAPGSQHMVQATAPAPLGGNTPPAEGPGRRLADSPAIETAKIGRRDNDKTVTAANSETSIRVSVEKVDQLINLVGELVITQAMLAEAASYLDPAQAEKLLAGIDLLSRNTRDMQESVMSIRMLPMSMVFSRFPRVVRDLAGKLNKQVEMKTIGENTELDKGLIEKISDPMTHLVRNSLDHGIETPEVRVMAGKNPKGTLTLKASHQGGNIVIEVIDDGAGLNRNRILSKARERGLPVNDAMTDHEVWQLIFAPGFSTADVVTDVSGRGVGMDVVKRNIEGMGGRVELESSTGHGTRTVIRLPLTLAILDGMSVGVGGETFIVPITSVIESLQPRLEDIRTMAGDSRMVHIRGEYLPFVSLPEAFNLPGVEDVTKGIVVVVETEDGKAALFVDELLGQHQVVIKNLEENYRKVPGVSGATIMGDGRVALILDVTAVTRMGLANTRRLRAA